MMGVVIKMMRLLLKSTIWFAAGVGIVVLAVPLTGFTAASPWQYTVQATGNVEALGADKVSIDLSSGTTVDQTLDLGVLSFLAIVYIGGTIMGRVLKKRPKYGKGAFS